jgi:hypothetical protein
MSKPRRVPSNIVPVCPDCQSDLSFVGSWSFRDLWGYTEVQTYECPTHGPIFVSPEISIAHGPDKAAASGDRDSLIPVPRKPTPTLNADSIAVPEPDSD